MHARALALCLAAAACSTPNSEPAPQPAAEAALADAFAARRPEIDAILAAALSEEEVYRSLERLVQAAPARLSGSPGYDRAVEWALAEMRVAGLANVAVEPCTAPHWERGALERLSRVDAYGGEYAIVALGGSVGTPAGGIEAEVVRVANRTELARLGERAQGRFVFFDEPMDPTETDPFAAYGRAVWQRSRGAIEAARLGGVGAIVRSMTLRRDDHPHTGAMRYDTSVPFVPSVAISTLGAEDLARRLAAGESVRLRLELDCRTLADAPSANVVGELVGRERPEEIVLVGAHLDAWDVGVGAHDDGAGCAQAIGAVRLLGELGWTPRRTIRVVLFANEENGLAGARAYAADHAHELANHVLALESDRGGFAPRGFDTDAEREGLEHLGAMAALLEPIGAERVVVGGGGADISTLAPSGVPLVGLMPESARYFDVHHAARDTLDQVSPRELQLGTAAMAALLWLVADDPVPFPRNPPRE
ncbi:MAG TPA: M20/M25/M40 family metallo-hydrolase [Planctomycetota bacterium]|nr:M20/M25/M40 family metallo-hydrolase [Planctomycetota bacterium]